jgi:hypothetical protein
MGQHGSSFWSCRGLARLFLLLAAVDSVLLGGWAVLRPDGLFTLLGLPRPRDLVVWRALGLLILTHGPFLVLAALRPVRCRGLLLVPLTGRALLAGVWCWGLASDRVPVHGPVLVGLLVHDLVWLPGFLAALLAFRET